MPLVFSLFLNYQIDECIVVGVQTRKRHHYRPFFQQYILIITS